MEAALKAFTTGVDSLRLAIRSLLDSDASALLLAGKPPTTAPTSLPVAVRLVQYNGAIVTLYGLLERFVESSLEGHLGVFQRELASFAELPPTLREQHGAASIELMSRLNQRKYSGITLESVVKNLASCFSDGGLGYRLNVVAFSHHSANLRHSVISDMWTRIGVDALGRKIRATDTFKTYISDQLGEHLEADRLADDVAFAFLSDLADRRNDVAHGVPSERLSLDLLLEAVDSVVVYCRALHEVATDAVAPAFVPSCVRLGEPIAVFDNRIVCFETEESISEGQRIIAETGDSLRPWRVGEVAEIQVNKKPVPTTHGMGPVKVALRLNFYCKANHTYAVARSKTVATRT